MNSKKYKDSLYNFREITDLRDMLVSSVHLYSEKDAYLVKRVKGGEYEPIKYRQVLQEVNALGTALIDMGLAGTKIAVIGENSYEWVLAYLAVACGVGVIVPLDRELPQEEIANLLARSEASAVFYSKKLATQVKEAEELLETPLKYNVCKCSCDEFAEVSAEMAGLAPQNLCLEELIEKGKKLVEAGDRRFIDAKINPDLMCALLFTSGTTGLAKGVMLSHKNITANVYNMSKYVNIPPDDFGLSVLPMHHSYELTCHIFTGIYQGMTIAICEGLKSILKNMQEAPAGVMLGVPLIFEAIHRRIMKQAMTLGKYNKLRKAIAVSKKLKLYNHPKIVKAMFKDIHETFGGHMNLFIAGGAAIDPTVIEDMQAMGIPMIQGYGMTENAPIIAVNKDRYSKPAAAGLPMPGTEVRIVDQDKNGVGEIICKGPSVMLGYYNNTEETNEVLKDGWLYTGDYGYFDRDGFLYVCGRKKSVIVTKNGKNIFPEEVEFYLSQSPYIIECLVHGFEDEKSGDIVVKAEVFLDDEAIETAMGKKPTEEERVSFIKAEIDKINDKMPIYKKVKRFNIREEEFEKTTSRKIKRFSPKNA